MAERVLHYPQCHLVGGFRFWQGFELHDALDVWWGLGRLGYGYGYGYGYGFRTVMRVR